MAYSALPSHLPTLGYNSRKDYFEISLPLCSYEHSYEHCRTLLRQHHRHRIPRKCSFPVVPKFFFYGWHIPGFRILGNSSNVPSLRNRGKPLNRCVITICSFLDGTSSHFQNVDFNQCVSIGGADTSKGCGCVGDLGNNLWPSWWENLFLWSSLFLLPCSCPEFWLW